MSSVLRDRVRAGKNAALRSVTGAAAVFLAAGTALWLFVPGLHGLGPGLVAAGGILGMFIPGLLMARSARAHRHARREAAFLTLLDAGQIRTRGNTAMSEIVNALNQRLSPESSVAAVFSDDRRTGMMTLTVTELQDNTITVHPMPGGTAKRVVTGFCGAFPPTLPWQTYLLCLPQRGAVIHHLMLGASEARALGISSVDPADTAALTKLHHLPL